MLRPAILLLLLVPAFCLAQKADRRMVKALETDIVHLEGSEHGVADYLISRYEKLKIPAWGATYRHPFKFIHGIELNDSRIVLGGQPNLLGGEAFPFPFSGNGSVSGDVLIEVQEMDAIWLLPLYANAAEAMDAAYDWSEHVWKEARQASKEGATGVVFYDAFGAVNPPRFDPLDKHEKLNIPVAFVGHKQWKELSANDANMVSVTLETKLSKPERSADNILAFIDNNAAKTIIIGANHDFSAGAATGTVGGAANDNASGTAAVLQLGEWLKKNRLRNYNVILAHFGAGRIGQLGAAALLTEPGFKGSHVAGMIDLYSIGLLRDSSVKLQLSPGARFPVRMTGAQALLKAGIAEAAFVERSGGSEYQVFERNGIPALGVSGEATAGMSGHPAQINYSAEARVIMALQRFLKQMDASAGKG